MQHTDLHPGNILVRVRPSGADKDGEEDAVANIDDVLLRPIAKGQARAQLQLVRVATYHLKLAATCYLTPETCNASHVSIFRTENLIDLGGPSCWLCSMSVSFTAAL